MIGLPLEQEMLGLQQHGVSIPQNPSARRKDMTLAEA